jgi:hypothetical protein
LESQVGRKKKERRRKSFLNSPQKTRVEWSAAAEWEEEGIGWSSEWKMS